MLMAYDKASISITIPTVNIPGMICVLTLDNNMIPISLEYLEILLINLINK